MSAVVGLAVAGVLVALPAGASGTKTVKCRGTADFCGATVHLVGGTSPRKVAIALSDTNLGSKPLVVRVLPDAASGTYTITHPTTIEGGSVYEFTLTTDKHEQRSARLILIFSAGRKQPVPSGS